MGLTCNKGSWRNGAPGIGGQTMPRFHISPQLEAILRNTAAEIDRRGYTQNKFLS